MKKYLFILVFLTGFIVVICAINKAININNEKKYDKYINIVRSSYNENYTCASYGDAFDKFFIIPKWNYIDVNNKNIVEFSGGFMYNNKETIIKVYFEVDESQNTIIIKHMFFNGILQDSLTQAALLNRVFESY